MRFFGATLVLFVLATGLPAWGSIGPGFSGEQDLVYCDLDRSQSLKVDRLMRRLADRYALASSNAQQFSEQFAKTQEFVAAAVARLRELHGSQCVDTSLLPDRFLHR